MTCICWDGTTLAADRYVWVNGAVALMTKIRRVGSSLIGVSGGANLAPQIFEWAKTDFAENTIPALQKDPKDHATIMRITEDRQILMYENYYIPWINERKFWAIGLGREVAIGALAAGATSVEAVEIAEEYSGNTGKGIDYLTF